MGVIYPKGFTFTFISYQKHEVYIVLRGLLCLPLQITTPPTYPRTYLVLGSPGEGGRSSLERLVLGRTSEVPRGVKSDEGGLV